MEPQTLIESNDSNSADPLHAAFLAATGGRESPNLRSVPILQQFCRDILAEAVAKVREEFPDAEPPEIDWQRLWATSPGTSPEEAAGHAAVAAQRIAAKIRRSNQAIPLIALPQQAPLPPPPAGGSGRALYSPLPSPPTPPAPYSVVEASESAVATRGAVVAEAVAPPPTVLPAKTTSGVETGKGSGHAERSPEWLWRRNRRLRRIFVAFGWVRDLGFVILAFAAWQVWGTSIEQGQAQQALRQQFQSHVRAVTSKTDLPTTGPALIAADIRVPEPPEGSVVGYLQIPSIGVDQYVVEGTAEGDLAKGPGHYVGTSMPGQAGNVAIAGHRTTYGAPFNGLANLKVGDRISLTSDSGEQLSYVVSEKPFVVLPNDVSVLNTVADNRLTLTTCNPRFSASQRLVAVALLSEPQAVVATPVVTPRKVSVVSDPIGWNMTYVLPVLFLVALLVVLRLAGNKARKVYGRIGRWLVLTPIWAAGLVLLFEGLTKLLPANL